MIDDVNNCYLFVFSEMDEQISESRKQEFQSDIADLERQFTYLREL